VINQQCVETHGRNAGHTEEDEHTGQQGSEFMLQSRVVIAEDQEDEQYCRKADSDCQARSKQDAGDHSQWPHREVSTLVYLSPEQVGDGYAKYALD
jgi:hypothetical protein